MGLEAGSRCLKSTRFGGEGGATDRRAGGWNLSERGRWPSEVSAPESRVAVLEA